MTGNRCVAVFGICVLISALVQARTVRITGQVVDTETSPVAGAALALYEVHYAYGEGQIRWKPVLNQTSDAVGRFAMRFESQHDNDFMLIAYKSGLSLSWQRLRRRENIVNCLLRLNRPGILAGTVLDAVLGGGTLPWPATHSGRRRRTRARTGHDGGARWRPRYQDRDGKELGARALPVTTQQGPARSGEHRTQHLPEGP